VKHLALAHGAYYVATGLWPIVHERSFEAVTGPKTERWLVKTAGALIAAIGASLVVAAYERRVPRSAVVAGIGSAVGLGAVDLVYALRQRISRIYLADAAIEVVLAVSWLTSAARSS
jgi:hypothetical protein